MTYTNGTVTVANNSNIVNGINTKWIINRITDDCLIQIGTSDPSWYQIISVNSDTSITIQTPFAGTSVVNTSYSLETSKEFLKYTVPPITAETFGSGGSGSGGSGSGGSGSGGSSGITEATSIINAIIFG